MDYVGWELERQRAALAALLLGGGTAEEDGAVQDGKREVGVSGREPAAERDLAKEAGRYAGNSAYGIPGVWETIRKTGRRAGRRGRLGGPETPVSAWEEVLDAEAAADTLERKAWGMDEVFPESFGGIVSGGELPSGGTGAWERAGTVPGGYAEPEEFPDRRAEPEAFPDGWEYQETARETAAERTAPMMRAFAGERSADARADGGRAVGGTSFAVRPGGIETAGSNTAIRRYASTGGARRDGGGVMETLGRPVIFQEMEDGGGTGPWGGGWGTAVIQAENSARALSRAVQRDARRYDGGFMIY